MVLGILQLLFQQGCEEREVAVSAAQTCASPYIIKFDIVSALLPLFPENATVVQSMHPIAD